MLLTADAKLARLELTESGFGDLSVSEDRKAIFVRENSLGWITPSPTCVDSPEVASTDDTPPWGVPSPLPWWPAQLRANALTAHRSASNRFRNGVAFVPVRRGRGARDRPLVAIETRWGCWPACRR